MWKSSGDPKVTTVFFFHQGPEISLPSANTADRDRMILDETISNIMKIYSQMDDEIAMFKAVTGLQCPPG
jgi:hypothetical protein